jgi:RNA 2',3'-cyclic 3'-phosphodiesterase
LTEAGVVRAFLAVPADPTWVESARELVSSLRSELPGASWTRPESWHMTLLFLGEIPRPEVERFATKIAPHAEAMTGGDLEGSAAVIFPPRGAARVLAVGFADSPVALELGRLAAAASALAPSVQSPKLKTQKRFHPHITFARLRHSWPHQAVERYRAVVDGWRPPAFRARSCVLFQSRLDPAGAVHTPLGTWNFMKSRVESNA